MDALKSVTGKKPFVIALFQRIVIIVIYQCTMSHFRCNLNYKCSCENPWYCCSKRNDHSYYSRLNTR